VIVSSRKARALIERYKEIDSNREWMQMMMMMIVINLDAVG